MSDKIFISIACFMDKDILNTIENCLAKAKHPNNIVFGICVQHDPLDDFLKPYNKRKNFRIKRINWKNAKGPTYARYFCTKLLKNEKYYLQIDCHSRFFQDWDVIAIKCLNECKDPKAIITNFPISISKMSLVDTSPLNKSTAKFQSLSLESIKLGSVQCSARKPTLTYYLSGAFLFGKSIFIKEVPHDPHLIYSYQTIEQQFYAIRLFTHGWNLYMPSAHVLATNYNKSYHFDSKGNRVTAPMNAKSGKLSWDRVLYYYGIKSKDDLPDVIKKDIDLYGLGKERSLEEFFEKHNEKGCIDKLKSGLTYNKGVWKNQKTYKCTNPLLNTVIQKNVFFSKSTNSVVDFEWNIRPQNLKSKLHHYPFKNVFFIDNKKTLFQHLINLNYGIPKTYFNVNELPNNIKGNHYLKYAGNNGGKNVFIYNEVKKIINHVAKDSKPYVIQEEIKDMMLIDNKKFVLRLWIIIINNDFYISTNGCCIVHETKYDPSNLDRKIHIDHDISKISYVDYNKTNFYEKSFPHVIRLSKSVCKIISSKMKFIDNCYQVLGLDIIFNRNSDPYLIEINSWPNMSVPYGQYKIILNEFFEHFINDIVVKNLSLQNITDTEYFKKL